MLALEEGKIHHSNNLVHRTSRKETSGLGMVIFTTVQRSHFTGREACPSGRYLETGGVPPSEEGSGMLLLWQCFRHRIIVFARRHTWQTCASLCCRHQVVLLPRTWPPSWKHTYVATCHTAYNTFHWHNHHSC